jgi:hypothetical protein
MESVYTQSAFLVLAYWLKCLEGVNIGFERGAVTGPEFKGLQQYGA